MAMRVMGLVVLLWASGCAAEFVAADAPIQGKTLLIAFDNSKGSESFGELQRIYPHVNGVPSITQYTQEQVFEQFQERSSALPKKAQSEGVVIPAGSYPSKFESGFVGAVRLTRDVKTGEGSKLDPKLAARLKKDSGADTLMLGRVYVFAKDWRQVTRRTKASQGIFYFFLRFGVGLEYTIYDLNTGESRGSFKARNPFEYQARRRHPPDPSLIGATGDPKVGERLLVLCRTIAERVVARHMPTID